ncbi:glycosyltransferase family 1 protein [Parabacteroides sp. OttesenSCG-928-N08]|nr:glycosyltransferase family 1 protein [Parabacteroides sp. OttesenSCG-928-N08]
MARHLHLISFNIPFPPNYGGIIDVFYKLKTLAELDVKIILHCFEYERPPAPALESYCEKVYYYKRKTGLMSNLSLLPYNVISRKHPELIANLLKDEYPILFEGLHSCYYLSDPRLKGRFKVFRPANIEHDYYRYLASSSGNLIEKSFFCIEALRFKWYEPVAEGADHIVAVSLADADHLRRHYLPPVDFMPCFHANEAITILPGGSDYILYHAKLSVPENEKAAMYLTRHIFNKLPYRSVIAGMNPTPALQELVSRYPNITLVANPSQEQMEQLIHEAHIHALITFQDTGLKLKLLNSLFAGRHIVANKMMLRGTGLESLCHLADSPEDFLQACHEKMKRPFTEEMIEERKQQLLPRFSNKYQGERLCEILFSER